MICLKKIFFYQTWILLLLLSVDQQIKQRYWKKKIRGKECLFNCLVFFFQIKGVFTKRICQNTENRKENICSKKSLIFILSAEKYFKSIFWKIPSTFKLGWKKMSFWIAYDPHIIIRPLKSCRLWHCNLMLT